jgi:pimeloyl-ACP methyl ester carboxylesterase
MPAVEVNDTRLYYERDGRGPAMLFVHGMCGDAEVWADQARRFADRYTCVRYDRRATPAAPAERRLSATGCTPTTPPPSSTLSTWRRA